MCLTDTQETINVYLFQKDTRGKRMAPEKHMRFENLWFVASNFVGVLCCLKLLLLWLHNYLEQCWCKEEEEEYCCKGGCVHLHRWQWAWMNRPRIAPHASSQDNSSCYCTCSNPCQERRRRKKSLELSKFQSRSFVKQVFVKLQPSSFFCQAWYVMLLFLVQNYMHGKLWRSSQIQSFSWGWIDGGERWVPWMWGAFNGLLAILAPGVIIRRNISKLVADCWHPDCPLHSQFSVCKAKKKFIVHSQNSSSNSNWPQTLISLTFCLWNKSEGLGFCELQRGAGKIEFNTFAWSNGSGLTAHWCKNGRHHSHQVCCCRISFCLLLYAPQLQLGVVVASRLQLDFLHSDPAACWQ